MNCPFTHSSFHMQIEAHSNRSFATLIWRIALSDIYNLHVWLSSSYILQSRLRLRLTPLVQITSTICWTSHQSATFIYETRRDALNSTGNTLMYCNNINLWWPKFHFLVSIRIQSHFGFESVPNQQKYVQTNDTNFLFE